MNTNQYEKQKISSSDIRDNILYILAHAHRKMHIELETLLKSEGVQVAHWRILEILHNKQALTMGELAEAVLMNHPTLTKMIDKMVADGVIHRSLDPEDNRRVRVLMTDLGLDLYRRIHTHGILINKSCEDNIGVEKIEKLKILLGEIINSNENHYQSR